MKNAVVTYMLCLFLVGVVPLFAEQRCSSGVCFVSSVEVEQGKGVQAEKLELKGVLTHRYLGFKVFTVGYYAPASSGSAIPFKEFPQRLVLQYHRGITAEQFQESSDKFLPYRSDEEKEEIASTKQDFYSKMRDVSEGDRYTIEYSPKQGMRLFWNDEKLVEVNDSLFAERYFGIWIDDAGMLDDRAKVLRTGVEEDKGFWF